MGKNILKQANNFFINHIKNNKIVIIYDSNIEKIHLPTLMSSLKNSFNDIDLIKINSGEKSKSINTLRVLINEILSVGINRNTVLVAFGGGVIALSLTSVAAYIITKTQLKGREFLNFLCIFVLIFY